MSQRWRALQRVMLSPTTIGDIAKSVLVLAQFEHKYVAGGSNSNATRIYEPSEMDADHVTAWSKGGASDLSNCEMLCVPHNRSKGNR